MQKQRIAWADVAKGLGILAVILGHLGVPILNRLVFPWHMPLFFIISGMFLSLKTPPLQFCKKKVQALIIPFVVTSMALIAAEGFWGMYSSGLSGAVSRIAKTAVYALCGSGSLPVFGIIRGIGAIWFLEALCIALITLRILLQCKFKYLIMAFLFLSAWFSAKFVWLPFNLQSGLFAVPFVFYGFAVLKKADPTSVRSKVFSVFGLIAFSILLYLNRPVMSMVRNYAMIWDLLAAPLIVHFVILISDIISRWSLVCSVLTWYGKNSLTLLCCHLFELNEIPWGLCFAHLGMNINNGYLRLLLLIASKIVFVTIATLVINRVKRKVLLRQIAP